MKRVFTTHQLFNIKPLINKYNDELIEHETNFNPLCYVQDFQIPKQISSLNHNLLHNQSYDIIFSLGSDAEYQCIGYIINPTNIATDNIIDIYYWKLPESDNNLDALGPMAVYSEKYGLICISEYFQILQFDDYDKILNENEWKWECVEMETQRHYPVSTMITDDKLFISGGTADVNGFECLSTANITMDIIIRYKWMDNQNIINIASLYKGEFERMDLRQNKWITYINNDNKDVDKIFGIQVEDNRGRLIINF